MQPYRLRRVPELASVLIYRMLDRRAVVAMPGIRLGRGGEVCQVDRVIWSRGKVALRGVNTAKWVTVGMKGEDARSIEPGPFQVTLSRPLPDASLCLAVTIDGTTEDQLCEPPRRARETRARALALPRVLRDIAAESPALLALLKKGDPAISAAIQRRLGLGEDGRTPLLPRNLFGECVVPLPRAAPAIVLPVFNGFDALGTLLNRLHESCGAAHHLILVDDGSDDPRVLPRLTAYLAAHPDCTKLIRQKKNLGFVAAANAGIETALQLTDGHIVLLNSDTLPPDNWLSRLIAPIERDRNVASVTPVSNNAEILSIPSGAGAEMPPPEAVAEIDRVAAAISPEVAAVNIPTGIGFCMALNRAFVTRVGGFDSAFGRGYGEEVDWCQKARCLGGRHLCAGNLFVGHQGAASFGEAARDRQRRNSSAMLTSRYPTFDAEVRDWCEADPLAATRLALTLAWLGQATDDAVSLFVAHSLGGGAEAALQVEIAGAFAAGAAGVVVVRVGGPSQWRLEVRLRDGEQVCDLENTAQLLQLLNALPRKAVVFSCGVGSHDPHAVPRLLLALAQNGSPLDLRLHDYLAISPSWTLLDDAGTYRGPRAGRGEAGWRAAWGEVLDHVREVTAFSEASAAIFDAAYPEVRDRIRVRPHRLAEAPPAVPMGGQTVGVLGSINRAKGADVLVRLAECLARRRIVVIGEMDGRFGLSAPHRVHGRYKRAEIAGLARRYDVGLWLVPSIWPETFSFVTHEALATGLPVLAFNLGAQAEAVRRAANGHLAHAGPEDAEALAQDIERLFAAQSPVRLRPAS